MELYLLRNKTNLLLMSETSKKELNLMRNRTKLLLMREKPQIELY
jgi:hypothetical protein